MTTFIYPGQGSQAVGMGIGVAETYPEALAVFDCASEIAGFDMYELCAHGPAEKLSQTVYTQPALYTVEAAITDVLKNHGIIPTFAAGHSLGEFSAWYAAEVFSFEDGLRLVTERGRIMNDADPGRKGAMAAVIGLTSDEVGDILKDVFGTIVIANFNSPLQMVISGERSAVDEAGSVLKDKGARRVIPLKVSGAFHSPLMEDAREEFAAVVDDIALSDASIPVFCNVSASPVTDADLIREIMVKQLTSPVRWIETVRKLSDKGVEEALEIGPGNTLAGLAKRIDDAFTVKSVPDVDAIMEVIHG